MTGLFFDDELPARKQSPRLPPPTPETGWRPPREFPRLDSAAVLGIDCETRELDFDNGPGWARGQGHVIGFSVAAHDTLGNTGRWYFPVRHEVEPEYNLDPAACFAWLRDVCALLTPKVGANLIYDVGWLAEEGIAVAGELHDVQFAEALLNEEGEVNLDYLGLKYCQQGKESNVMYDWIRRAYGARPGHERGELWRTSPRLVGAYGEQDADLPIRVLNAQWPRMAAEGLLDLYRTECDLITLLVAMRRQGVAVAIPRAEQLYVSLGKDIQDGYTQLTAKYGVKIDSVNSGAQLAKICAKIGIAYPKTKDGKPSFQKTWLSHLDHEFGADVLALREYEKMRGSFVKNAVLEKHRNGRIFPSFHPLRADEGGTRSGRFSSSDPNIQQVPARSKLGKQIRELFIPNPGDKIWRKFDYSQIEYRTLVHYAVGAGADAVRAQYNDDPDTDYHDLTAALVKSITGQVIARKPIKNINFGLLYGMGLAKLCRMLGLSDAEGQSIMRAYHEGNPYVRATMEAAAKEVEQYGYITTILGRRSRFNLWEPVEVDYEKRAVALPYEAALARYGVNIKRAHTHKAINRRLQGSSADMIKKAMCRAWKDGIFEATGLPLVTVHDELGFSDSLDRDDAFRYLQHEVMENTIKLRVPVRADMDIGASWGDCSSLDDLLKQSPDDWRVGYMQDYGTPTVR